MKQRSSSSARDSSLRVRAQPTCSRSSWERPAGARPSGAQAAQSSSAMSCLTAWPCEPTAQSQRSSTRQSSSAQSRRLCAQRPGSGSRARGSAGGRACEPRGANARSSRSILRWRGGRSVCTTSSGGPKTWSRASGFAPRSSSSFATGRCPSKTVQSSAVWPKALTASTAAPWSSSSATMRRLPWMAAQCSAVVRNSERSSPFTSAPAASSARTSESLPRRTARCSRLGASAAGAAASAPGSGSGPKAALPRCASAVAASASGSSACSLRASARTTRRAPDSTPAGSCGAASSSSTQCLAQKPLCFHACWLPQSQQPPSVRISR